MSHILSHEAARVKRAFERALPAFHRRAQNGYYSHTTEEQCREENDFLLDAAHKDPTHVVAASADWAQACSTSKPRRTSETGIVR